jgi:nucleotide-binding universal stress UspA family protein
MAMGPIRWIVVGIDFSEGSLRALEYALAHASTVGASVACLHAYEDTAETPAFHDPAAAIRQQLDALIAQRRPPASSVRVDAIVRRGAPWEKLANLATDLGADIIVVGADGERGASAHGLLGTVANRLVTRSTCSVVVVPPGPTGEAPSGVGPYGLRGPGDERPIDGAEGEAFSLRPRRGRRRGRVYRGPR